MIKYSIGIPAYKSTFLKECIDSILANAYTEFELIIVNDASPEDLETIVFSYKDERIRYYKNEKNCGAVNVVDNWNKCLNYAKGEYFICMGDDDMLYSTCLEEYNALIEQYPQLNVFHGRTVLINEESHVSAVLDGRPIYESVYSLMWHRWNGRRQFIGDFLFRTTALKKEGGFYKLPLAWGSDDITAYLLATEHGIANTDAPVFKYRVNAQTISKTGNVDIKLEAIQQEKRWTVEFLANTNQGNSIDTLYVKMLQNELEKRFAKKRILQIASDISSSYFRFFYWLNCRRKHELSFSMIVYALIEAVKMRRKKLNIKE